MKNTNYPKDAVVPKSVLLPFILITSLFALWGFANDITNPMVAGFKTVLEISNFKASLVQFAFYGGYFTMALPAAMFVQKYTYKRGIMLGLVLYAVGALLFIPATSFETYGLFLVALYVLTFGLAFLETTSNPYILSMGSPETATRRLNLAQTFNPIGSIMGILTAKYFILKLLQSDNEGYEALDAAAKAAIKTADLMVIRNPYVALGLVVIAFLVAIGLSKMPKSKGEGGFNLADSLGRLIQNKKYRFGVIAQAFYVGAQIMVWTYIVHYGQSVGIAKADALNYTIASMVLFLTGRAIATALMKYVNTGTLLMFFSFGAIATALGAIFIQGIVGLYSLVGVSFFMSLMFPTIYGIALRGLSSDDAKFGAAGLVMAIVGGALMPPLQGYILDIGGPELTNTLILGVPEINFSFILPLVCFAVVAAYGYKSGTVYLKEE